MTRALLIFLLVGIAYADDPPDNRPPDNRPPDRGVDVDVRSRTEIDARSKVSVDTPVNVNTTISNQRQVPDAYFSYTPNFIDCGRVLGFQFGNASGISSLGVPLPRDKACDVWKAVNEAQENGHILLSYAFMCEIKNVQKVWGRDRCNEITDTAGTWWIAMARGDESTVADTIARFEPPDSTVIAVEQHNELEEELAVTQRQLGYVQNEHAEQQQVQQQQQQVIDDYRRRESQKQVELGEFLKKLESRDDNEEEK